MPFELREAVPGDFEQLFQIDRRCFPPGISYSRLELRSYMTRPGAFTLIAETPAVVGFIVTELGRRKIGHVITIDVLPGARRLGLGSALLSAAEGRVRAAGGREIYLETAVDNLAAISFYKKHDYYLEGTIPRYYPNGVDAFTMSKQLS